MEAANAAVVDGSVDENRVRAAGWLCALSACERRKHRKLLASDPRQAVAFLTLLRVGAVHGREQQRGQRALGARGDAPLYSSRGRGPVGRARLLRVRRGDGGHTPWRGSALMVSRESAKYRHAPRRAMGVGGATQRGRCSGQRGAGAFARVSLLVLSACNSAYWSNATDAASNDSAAA